MEEKEEQRLVIFKLNVHIANSDDALFDYLP